MSNTLSDKVIDFILNHDFPIYENMEFYDSQYKSKWIKETSNDVLIHNTYIDNLNAIIDEGLTTKTQRSNCFIWGVNPHYLDKKKPLRERWRCYGSSVFFTLPQGIFVEFENDSEYGIYGDIPPENITNIDILLTEDDFLRLSDIPYVIDDYGLSAVKEAYYNDNSIPSWLTKKQFYDLFDFGIENTYLLYN